MFNSILIILIVGEVNNDIYNKNGENNIIIYKIL